MTPRCAAGSLRRPLSLLLLASLSPLGALAQSLATQPSVQLTAPSTAQPSAPPSVQPSASVSQALGEPRPASLRETLSLAAKQSPDVAAARAQAAIAEAGVNRAWTAWQPDVSVSAQYVHTNAPAVFDLGSIIGLVGGVFRIAPVDLGLIPPPVTISAADSRYATVQISQPLFTPAGAFLIGPAKAGARAAELGALEAREQVLLAVARTYLGLQGIRQLIQAAHEAEAVALQRESESQAQLKVGTTVEAALLRAQTETAQARVQLAQLSGQHTQLLALLGALVGEPVQPVEVGATDNSWPIPGDDQRPWEDTFAVRSAAEALRATEGKLTYDRLQWLPSLAAQGRGLYNSNTGFTGRNFSYELSVAASLPLYDRGQRFALTREDEARRDQARAQYESARARAHANWVAAQANLESARVALAQTDCQAQLASRVQQQVAAGYKAGIATSLEMSDADTRRFLAASTAAQARAQLEVRQVELAAAAGRIASSLEVDAPAPPQ